MKKKDSAILSILIIALFATFYLRVYLSDDISGYYHNLNTTHLMIVNGLCALVFGLLSFFSFSNLNVGHSVSVGNIFSVIMFFSGTLYFCYRLVEPLSSNA